MNTPAFIPTRLGQVAVYVKNADSKRLPIIFLHGVYFDHHLWDATAANIEDRPIITLDMPMHGASKTGVPASWSLDDCAEMLIEVLDSLKIAQTVAIGHSWGSMTLVRAASKYPDRFAAVGLGNMPFEAASNKQKRNFRMQHTALIFRNFYEKQTAKALFAPASLKENPELLAQLKTPMSKLTHKEVKRVDQFVIINAQDASALITGLKVPAFALKGTEDYVPQPPVLETTLVAGGHVSPLENPQAVIDFCGKVVGQAESALAGMK